MNIGIFASHNGSNLQAIIDACLQKVLNANISIVISNNSKSGAADRAKKHNIPFCHLSSFTHPDPDNLDNAIFESLKQNNADVIFLAGYMKKLGKKTLAEYSGKILNTHPALLPKYGGKGMFGMNVHRAVIEAREIESGVSIHLVDTEYDTGKVIGQTKVSVFPTDTPEDLCNRIMTRERVFVVEILQDILAQRIKL